MTCQCGAKVAVAAGPVSPPTPTTQSASVSAPPVQVITTPTQTPAQTFPSTYRVVTIGKPGVGCCRDPLEDIHREIEAECNRQQRDGFVLVSAFDTRSAACPCCGSQVCWKKTACLIFGRT